MAQIVTVKNGQTDEIEYPRTVKSALLNDDGTFLNPLTPTNIINDLTTGGETNVLSAEQGKTLNNKIKELVRVLRIERYGVVFSGSNPQGTRVEDAVGMIANVAVDDQIVVNDFDSIPFFNRRICCGTHDVNGNFIVNAYRDEPGFAWDGTNGELYYEETPFYWTGDMNKYVAVSAVPLDGYTLSPRFRNGTDKE